MDKDNLHQLVEAFRLYSARELKSLQTSLTKTANSILNDGLHRKLTDLYTDDEIRTLKEAANILRSAKSRVEHVKEVKARKEKQEQEQWDQAARIREKLMQDNFPHPEKDRSRYRDILIWHIAGNKYVNPSTVLHQQALDFIKNDIRRWSEKETECTVTETVDRSALHWRSRFLEELRDKWSVREKAPTQEFLDRLLVKFKEEWKPAIERDHRDLLDALDNEILALSSDKIRRIRTTERKKGW